MPKLDKYEIQLLAIVKSCQPCVATVVHDQYEGDLKDTVTDLGLLYNSGHLSVKSKQYSLTEKGVSTLADLSNIPPAKTQTMTNDDLVITDAANHPGPYAITDMDNSHLNANDIITDEVENALNDLERQLAIEVVLLTPVEQYELKCEVIDRLSGLLDPSIASILDDIKQDVTQLHEKAA
jgi:DNA-binding PadR family transcriptional regulator